MSVLLLLFVSSLLVLYQKPKCICECCDVMTLSFRHLDFFMNQDLVLKPQHHCGDDVHCCSSACGIHRGWSGTGTSFFKEYVSFFVTVIPSMFHAYISFI